MTQQSEHPPFPEHSPWLDLPEFDWSSITKDLALKAYPKGTPIYRQAGPSEYVYLAEEGRVQLDVCSVDGDRRIFFVAEAGALFGELSPFDGMPYICNATAITDCQVYRIPIPLFMEHLLSDHSLSLNVMKMMTKKMRLLSTLIMQLSFNDSTYRVAYALGSLAHQYSDRTPEGYYKLKLKYTHQDLADLTGLSRVSVSNVLLRMTAQGILDKDKTDGYTIIRDLDALLTVVDEQP